MLMADRTSKMFGRKTNFELQIYRDGHWVIGAVFDDRAEALHEALRQERSGKIVQLREESQDSTGKFRTARTVYLSSTIKNIWKAERQRLAARAGLSRRTNTGADGNRLTELNPFVLLAIFSLVTFLGIAAIFALRTLHDMV